jgi:branched-chain amino acid transport system substrate-binding protein
MIAEGIRNAQKITGKKVVNGEDVRRGLETMNLTEARWTELGLPNFAAHVQVTCADHSGHAPAYMQQWDGAKWVKISDWIQPIKDKVSPLVTEAAKEYVDKNTGWPKRTEACDKAS